VASLPVAPVDYDFFLHKAVREDADEFTAALLMLSEAHCDIDALTNSFTSCWSFLYKNTLSKGTHVGKCPRRFEALRREIISLRYDNAVPTAPNASTYHPENRLSATDDLDMFPALASCPNIAWILADTGPMATARDTGSDFRFLIQTKTATRRHKAVIHGYSPDRRISRPILPCTRCFWRE
jgi:hypothetical protein